VLADTHESPHGQIEVRWDLTTQFVLTVTVPPGCTADAALSDGRTLSLGPGRHTCS
jgi:alpha-L-rhamnosidase